MFWNLKSPKVIWEHTTWIIFQTRNISNLVHNW